MVNQRLAPYQSGLVSTKPERQKQLIDDRTGITDILQHLQEAQETVYNCMIRRFQRLMAKIEAERRLQ